MSNTKAVADLNRAVFKALQQHLHAVLKDLKTIFTAATLLNIATAAVANLSPSLEPPV